LGIRFKVFLRVGVIPVSTSSWKIRRADIAHVRIPMQVLLELSAHVVIQIRNRIELARLGGGTRISGCIGCGLHADFCSYQYAGVERESEEQQKAHDHHGDQDDRLSAFGSEVLRFEDLKSHPWVIHPFSTNLIELTVRLPAVTFMSV
jgi:hypothetical protein